MSFLESEKIVIDKLTEALEVWKCAVSACALCVYVSLPKLTSTTMSSV